MALLLFMLQVVLISCSGVLAPGPMTAAAIAAGTRTRYAGALMALGHAVVEFPLMLAIVLGAGRIFESNKAQMVISLAGGILLLVMAIGMLRSLKTAGNSQSRPTKATPFLTGVVLSGCNPYFLLWWATIGLALATTASRLGIWAFVLFVIVHWLCDLIWLTALSWASFKGSALFGPRSGKIVQLICSMVLLVFGLLFIYNAILK